MAGAGFEPTHFPYEGKLFQFVCLPIQDIEMSKLENRL